MAENSNNEFSYEAFLTETDKPHEKEDVKNFYLKTFYKSLKPGNAWLR
jgi:hypothetical protein